MDFLGIEITMPITWLALAVVLAIIEALTMGLTTIWFAGGALAGFIAALAGAVLWLQVVIFLVVSTVLLVFTRKIFLNKLHTGEEKTNIDALIGKSATAISDIAPGTVGQVKLGGQEWSAVQREGTETISKGEKVIVKEVEGVKLIVTSSKY